MESKESETELMLISLQSWARRLDKSIRALGMDEVDQLRNISASAASIILSVQADPKLRAASDISLEDSLWEGS
jgi:hypothetical protein